MDETDAQIVDRVLSGETDAFKHLVWRHQQLLYDLSFRLTGDTAEAEDIAQAAFIKMFSSLSSYKKELAFRNWAYTITLNIARNRLKRKAVLRFLPLGIFSPADGKEEERHIQEPMEEEGGRHDAGCAAQDLSNALEKAFIFIKRVSHIAWLYSKNGIWCWHKEGSDSARIIFCCFSSLFPLAQSAVYAAVFPCSRGYWLFPYYQLKPFAVGKAA